MDVYTVNERCSCGSRHVASGSYYPHLAAGLATWRTNHRHEQPERIPIRDFPPIPQGSGSTVERAEQFDHDNRSPIGFGGRT